MKEVDQLTTQQQTQNFEMAPVKASNKKIKYIFLAIILIFVTVSSVFGYVLGKGQKLTVSVQSKLNPKLTVTQPISPAATYSPVNAFSGWKTYSSSTLGITLMYPPDVSIQARTTGRHDQTYVGDDVTFRFPSPCTAQCQYINISVTNIPSQMDGFHAIESGYSHNSVWHSQDESLFKQTVIGGISGYKSTDGAPAYAFAQEAFVVNQGRLYDFRYEAGAPDLPEEKLFNQMLSTFQFLQ